MIMHLKEINLDKKEYLLDYNDEFISGEGLVMPDGTKLNGGKGFDYEKWRLVFIWMLMCLWEI